MKLGVLDRANREVTTDVFQASSAAVSIKSALFVAWGQLLTYDISLTIDNSTEPFDVPCNDVVDVWCPLGASSDEISFDRSNAGMDNNSVRSPINYATAYIDLDFVYGRNELDAEELRTLEGGMMNITENGVPFRNADGTWLVRPYAKELSLHGHVGTWNLRLRFKGPQRDSHRSGRKYGIRMTRPNVQNPPTHDHSPVSTP